MPANELMQGFPPSPETQVTLANWRKPPFNRWSFQHVREIVPSADIPNDPDNVWVLPRAAKALGDPELLVAGRTRLLSDLMQETDTDAMTIIHRGEIICECYANGMARETPHILMSVSKSVLAVLAGILIDQGRMDENEQVTAILPELAGSAFEGATIRQLLDMRAGVRFDEDYLATSGPIFEYRKSTNWEPLALGQPPNDLRSFLCTLTDHDGPHGGRFHYVSPNTDLLGWVIERMTGRRFADLLSELIWKPLGARSSAYITVDRLGAPRAAGGMCTTVNDLARLGQLIVQNGRRGTTQIIPESWIADVLHNGDTQAWDSGDFAAQLPGMPMHYRSKWYVLRGDKPMLFGWGIFGQFLFVDPANEIVIAKFSSQELPSDEAKGQLTLAMAEGLRRHLAGSA